MTSTEVFESTLKEVVQAKRLSASKIQKLTEIALNLMEQDTQLVSILYRTHKSLGATEKTNSLYVFDALCRAARSKANKKNLTGSVNSEKGNCATFLLKIEGVLEGLFQDMATKGNTESKEKSQKILDIWTKSNTFSSPVIMRLKEVIQNPTAQETEKVKDPPPLAVQIPQAVASPFPDSRAVTTPSITPVTPGPQDALQTTLLALLTQAAASSAGSGSQTTPNTKPPQLDAQALLLQHLAQSNFQPVAGNANPQPIFSPFPNGVSNADQSHRSPRSPVGSSAVDGHRDPRRRPHDESISRDHDYGRGYDDRTGPRGSLRGGYRGRGRGDGRDRWNDRSRYRDRGHGPPTYGRRSRSPSPRRASGFAPQNPQNYNSTYSPVHDAAHVVASKSPATDVDEFGRERRQPASEEAHSPSPGANPAPADPRRAHPARSSASAGPSAVEKIEKNNIADVDQMSMSSDEPSSVSATQEPSKLKSVDVEKVSESSSQIQQQALGLEQFDITAFDYTSPQSWKTLGEMWQVTHGYLPSQEELLQFVMMGGMMQNGLVAGSGSDVADPRASVQQQPSSSTQQQSDQSNWFGDGLAPVQNGGVWNEGGHYSHGYNNGNHRKGSDYGYSDAIVLGGSAEGDVSSESVADAQVDSSTDSSRAGGGGRMQRVGDRWIFVRDNTAPNT